MKEEKKLLKEFESMIDRKIKNKTVPLRMTEDDHVYVKKSDWTFSQIFKLGLELIKRRKK